MSAVFPRAILLLLVIAGATIGVMWWHGHGVARAPGQPAGTPHPQDREGAEERAHADEVRLDAAARKRWAVVVRRASPTVLRPSVEAPGRVTLDRERLAHIGTPLRGRAVDILAKVGDSVKKGDVLLIVDSPELGEAQSDYLQRRTAASVAGPKTKELAKRVFERAKSLQESSQLVARSDVERREIDYREAEAAEKSAKGSLEAAENRLHLLGMSQQAVDALERTGEVHPRLEIAAPIDGEVIEREVTLGEVVGPERESLLVVADLTTLWVLADVAEAQVSAMVKGARVRVVATSGQETAIQGAVSYVSPALNPATRTAEARIEVKNGHGPLKPGMFVRAEIETEARGPDRGAVLAIPEPAMQTIAGRTVVFVPVPGEQDMFVARPVIVGRPVMGLVPVYSGLKDGEECVVSGTFILKAELVKGAASEH